MVATACNPEQLVELQVRYSGNIRTVALDVTNEAQAKAAFDAAIASFGVLDVLVNNAGYGYVCPVEDTPLTDSRAQIETNLFGVIIMTKAVRRRSLRRGCGWASETSGGQLRKRPRLRWSPTVLYRHRALAHDGKAFLEHALDDRDD